MIDVSEHTVYHKQAYDFTIEMEMPESPENIELGMFMITLDVLERNYGQIFTESRPVLNCCCTNITLAESPPLS